MSEPPEQAPTKPRNTKSIQSILPDHLDAINETSENSESSSSAAHLMEPVLPLEARKKKSSSRSSSPRKSSSRGSSPTRSSLTRKSPSSASSPSKQGSGSTTTTSSSSTTTTSPSKSHHHHKNGSSNNNRRDRSRSPSRRNKSPSKKPAKPQPAEKEEDADIVQVALPQNQQQPPPIPRGRGESSSSISHNRGTSPTRRRLSAPSDLPVLEEVSERSTSEHDHLTVSAKEAHDDSLDGGGRHQQQHQDAEGDDYSDVSPSVSDRSIDMEEVERHTPKRQQQEKLGLSLHEKLQSLDPNSSVMMFSYDVDDEDGTRTGDVSIRSILSYGEHDDQELTWRLDPSESMSDWTLRVLNKGTKTVDEYHVHKNILAVGKRRSEYFVNVFKQRYRSSGSHASSASREEADDVTEVVMENCAAAVVPMLLDYMYSAQTVVQLSPETAPGMRYLSQFFGVRILFENVMKFIQRDLSLRTVVKYYQAARELDDKKIANLAARHCARNIHLIDTSHELFEVMDPEFFAKMLSSPGLDERKLHVSLLVTKYCQLHRDEMSAETFLAITDETNLPVVHHTAAITLLGIEADLIVATSVANMMDMTSLQERCIKGLAAHWRAITEQDPEQTARVCSKLPSFVVTELLLRSLNHAKKEGDRQVQSAALARNAKQVRANGSKSKTQPDGAAAGPMQTDQGDGTALENIKAEYERKLKDLQAVCYEKDKHIQSYYSELRRFERLPNSHDGKLVQSGRKEQPTAMPEVGKHSANGYLLAGRKLGGAKYPVFYYKKDGPSTSAAAAP